MFRPVSRVLDFVTKRATKFVIRLILGRVVCGEIDLDSLDVQLGEGKLELRTLELNCDYLNSLLANVGPFRLLAGRVNVALLQLRGLTSCQLQLEGLSLRVQALPPESSSTSATAPVSAADDAAADDEDEDEDARNASPPPTAPEEGLRMVETVLRTLIQDSTMRILGVDVEFVLSDSEGRPAPARILADEVGYLDLDDAAPANKAATPEEPAQSPTSPQPQTPPPPSALGKRLRVRGLVLELNETVAASSAGAAAAADKTRGDGWDGGDGWDVESEDESFPDPGDVAVREGSQRVLGGLGCSSTGAGWSAEAEVRLEWDQPGRVGALTRVSLDITSSELDITLRPAHLRTVAAIASVLAPASEDAHPCSEDEEGGTKNTDETAADMYSSAMRSSRHQLGFVEELVTNEQAGLELSTLLSPGAAGEDPLAASDDEFFDAAEHLRRSMSASYMSSTSVMVDNSAGEYGSPSIGAALVPSAAAATAPTLFAVSFAAPVLQAAMMYDAGASAGEGVRLTLTDLNASASASRNVMSSLVASLQQVELHELLCLDAHRFRAEQMLSVLPRPPVSSGAGGYLPPCGEGQSDLAAYPLLFFAGLSSIKVTETQIEVKLPDVLMWLDASLMGRVVALCKRLPIDQLSVLYTRTSPTEASSGDGSINNNNASSQPPPNQPRTHTEQRAAVTTIIDGILRDMEQQQQQPPQGSPRAVQLTTGHIRLIGIFASEAVALDVVPAQPFLCIAPSSSDGTVASNATATTAVSLRADCVHMHVVSTSSTRMVRPSAAALKVCTVVRCEGELEIECEFRAGDDRSRQRAATGAWNWLSARADGVGIPEQQLELEGVHARDGCVEAAETVVRLRLGTVAAQFEEPSVIASVRAVVEEALDLTASSYGPSVAPPSCTVVYVEKCASVRVEVLGPSGTGVRAEVSNLEVFVATALGKSPDSIFAWGQMRSLCAEARDAASSAWTPFLSVAGVEMADTAVSVAGARAIGHSDFGTLVAVCMTGAACAAGAGGRLPLFITKLVEDALASVSGAASPSESTTQQQQQQQQQQSSAAPLHAPSSSDEDEFF